MILSGLIRITAPSLVFNLNGSYATSSASYPNSTPPKSQVAYIMPGTTKSSVLLAADMRSTSYIKGHYTEFDSDEPTILVQVRFEGNHVPEHRILHEGPCT